MQDDFARDWKFDTEAIYSHSEQTKMSIGAGYAHSEYGSFEFGGFNPDGHTLMETIKPFIRLDHTFDDGSTEYVRWLSNILQCL